MNCKKDCAMSNRPVSDDELKDVSGGFSMRAGLNHSEQMNGMNGMATMNGAEGLNGLNGLNGLSGLSGLNGANSASAGNGLIGEAARIDSEK